MNQTDRGVLLDVQAIEVLQCRNSFTAAS